jgi:hypothetical protein
MRALDTASRAGEQLLAQWTLAVRSLEGPAVLQFRYEQIAEPLDRSRLDRSDEVEPVDAGVLGPLEQLVGDRRRRPDQEQVTPFPKLIRSLMRSTFWAPLVSAAFAPWLAFVLTEGTASSGEYFEKSIPVIVDRLARLPTPSVYRSHSRCNSRASASVFATMTVAGTNTLMSSGPRP